MKAIFYHKQSKQKFISPPFDWMWDRAITDLTIGKEYKVQLVAENRYTVINDYGVYNDYPSYLFVTIDEMREEKLNTILDGE